jgi:hypothetical protein
MLSKSNEQKNKSAESSFNLLKKIALLPYLLHMSQCTISCTQSQQNPRTCIAHSSWKTIVRRTNVWDVTHLGSWRARGWTDFLGQSSTRWLFHVYIHLVPTVRDRLFAAGHILPQDNYCFVFCCLCHKKTR